MKSLKGSFVENVIRSVKGWNGIFLLLTFIVVVLLFYQSLTSGTWYDESLTFRDYSSSIHQARHSFKSTNNHVLNSICICLAKRCFGDFEQFIRIPTLITGTLFIVSMAWVIRKIIRHPALRCVTLLFIFSIPYVFAYLFTARGYSYTMAIMGLYFVLTIYFFEHPIRLKFAWVPVVLLSFLNFVSLGAMLNSLFLIAALNAVFVLWISPHIYRDCQKRLLPIIINGVGIALLSGLALVWFYWPILNDVIRVAENPYIIDIAKGWKGWKSFRPFFYRLFVEQIFNFRKGGRWLFYLFLLLLGTGIIFKFINVFKVGLGTSLKKLLQKPCPGLYVSFVFILYFCLMLFYSGVLKKSPGMLRSHVFFLPLIGLLFGWLVDELFFKLACIRFSTWITGLICVYILIASFHFKPTLKPGTAGMSRPILRRLREFDPEQVWNLSFSKKMSSRSMDFYYYKQFDYKFNVTRPQQGNIFICKPDEQPQGSLCLDYEYFFDQCQCVVVINMQLDSQKHYVEIGRKKSK
jgi:hypothetical protein